MPKIALIAPGTNPEFAVQEPLNLGYLASYLEAHNIDVVIIDELAGQNVESELKSLTPDIVGITAVTPLAPDAYRIANLCKKMGILTVMGGVHASILPQEALKYVDIVVKGEGEEALLDIARGNIDSKKILTYPYIKDIDNIPPPARHLMQMDFYLRSKDRKPKSYLQFVPPGTKVAALLTSRGCPYACTFCHNTWRGIPSRYNSPQRVISEIKQLIKIYGIGALFFIEDNLFVNKKRIEKICNLLIQNKIDILWGGNARVDNIDLDILKLAKKAGCRQVTFGFESGSQRILNILNKKTTVEQNQKAIELCKKAGLLAQGTFIIGSPTETIEDIKKTQNFIRKNGLEEIVGVCIATPYPGTKLWEWCEQNNRIPKILSWNDFNYSEVPIKVCDDISPEELKQLRIEVKYPDSPIDLMPSIIKTIKNPMNFAKKVIRNPRRMIRNIKKLKFRL